MVDNERPTLLDPAFNPKFDGDFYPGAPDGSITAYDVFTPR
jgi:hypothetical protein